MAAAIVRFFIQPKAYLYITQDQYINHIIDAHRNPSQLEKCKSQFITKTPVLTLIQALLLEHQLAASDRQGELAITAHFPFPIGVDGQTRAICHVLEVRAARSGYIRTAYPQTCAVNCPLQHEPLCHEGHIALSPSESKFFEHFDAKMLCEWF